MELLAYFIILVLMLFVSWLERREYKQMHRTLKELRESVDKLKKRTGD